MSTAFYKGQQLGREDLNLFLVSASDVPVNAAEISYALYDFTTGLEVLIGPAKRTPANPSVGEYYASIIIPLDANLGAYRIRWTFRQSAGASIQQVLQEFEVIDKVTTSLTSAAAFSQIETDLIRRLRIRVRDNSPDRNYHFRPPTHETSVRQYNRVFGYIWEDIELQEYLTRALGMIIASPPRTPFANIDAMVRQRPEWQTLLITGAEMQAYRAIQSNWVADEFEYSIGGVSLNLDKASKYDGLANAAGDQFDKQLERAKLTVNHVLGLQQPKFGTGIRSSFGPYVGAGVLTPRKFMGF